MDEHVYWHQPDIVMSLCLYTYVLFIQVLSLSFLDLVSYHVSLPPPSEWYCEWMVIGKF